MECIMEHCEGKVIIGIDVSKDKLDIWNQQTERHEVAPNNPRSIGQWIKKHVAKDKLIWVGLEPTGGYEKEVVRQLIKQGVCTFSIHPNQLHHFAQGLGQGAKTDKQACQSLAAFVGGPSRSFKAGKRRI